MTGSGDCFPRCVSELLRIPLNDVPNFYMDRQRCGYSREEMEDSMHTYFRGKGFGFIEIDIDSFVIPPSGFKWYIVGGNNKQGVGHCVIAKCKFSKEGMIYEYKYDPNPSQEFIEEPETIYIFWRIG